MMKYILLALACVCMFAVASAQEVEVIVIDPYTVTTPSIVIVVNSDPFPQCDDRHTQDSSIIGGERGIQMCAIQGSSNSVLTAGTTDGVFQCAAPASAGGEALLQYDGEDGTIALDPSGLFGDPENNWTIASAFGIRTVVLADFTTTAELRVYSGSATDYCEATITIPGGSFFENVLVEFIDFSDVGAGCDFSNVGAFELEVQVDNNVDVTIEQLAIVGPIIYEECTCICPEFTCVIAIDYDDDGFVYYATSDFDDDGFNPTTDLSTVYTPGSPATPVSPGVTSFPTTFFTTFPSTFDTSFFGSTFLPSSFTHVDDDGNDGSSSGSSNNDDDDDSSAATIAPAFALVLVALALVL